MREEKGEREKKRRNRLSLFYSLQTQILSLQGKRRREITLQKRQKKTTGLNLPPLHPPYTHLFTPPHRNSPRFPTSPHPSSPPHTHLSLLKAMRSQSPVVGEDGELDLPHDGVERDGELRSLKHIVDPDDVPRVAGRPAGAVGADQRELLR